MSMKSFSILEVQGRIPVSSRDGVLIFLEIFVIFTN